MTIRVLLTATIVVIGACSSGVGSVGAVLGRDNQNGALFVREVPAGLAADKAGLSPGDQVLMIDGVYVGELDAAEIRKRLRGDVGTSVELTIVHGNTARHVKVVRTEFHPRPPQPKETKLEE